MTVNRKKKQAVRAFAATHEVSYSEALRLMGLKVIEATIQDREGETYWVSIDYWGAEVVWWVSETESATAVGSLQQWMSTADPASSGWIRLSENGQVRAAASTPSLWDSLPFMPTDTVAAVRELIERQAPSWENPSADDLIRIREAEGAGDLESSH